MTFLNCSLCKGEGVIPVTCIADKIKKVLHNTVIPCSQCSGHCRCSSETEHHEQIVHTADIPRLLEEGYSYPCYR